MNCAANGVAPTERGVERVQLQDVLWLALAVLVVVGTGLGTRMPWPADEPRFVLIARDMVLTGDWLFPRVGGDLYGDKPPVFFWLLALGYALTGSIKASFLVPSFIAACTVVALVYDLGRRLFGRIAGLAGALTLAFCVQFGLTMRGAQIDPVLCGLTTLSMYGFLRHLLLGPAWAWYFVGGLAAGVGVVTKGVGFLPLLVFIPYAFMRARGFTGLARIEGGARWALVVPAFLIGVAIWLVPMLVAVATRNDPNLVAYRNEILFQQTVERYASAWHHVKPWYYFLTEVIPPLWLPLSALLFWLVPRWVGAFRERDARVVLPLAWVLLTVLFFSLSAGKRGVYVFPALPITALAAASCLPAVFQRRGVERVSLALGAVLVVAALAVLVMDMAVGDQRLRETLNEAGVDSLAPVGVFAALGLLAWVVCAWKRPLLAWPTVFAALAVVWSYGIAPRIDGQRSASTFTREMLAQVPPGTELGLVAYKEQFLLYLDRPIVNFGHARWREGSQEAYDASVWLNAAPGRMLLIPESAVSPCFENAQRRPAGTSSGDVWLFVTGRADDACVRRGDPGRALTYTPPRSKR